ncbi:PREDICTED: classical arabinogalactan protein 10-like [Vollenhovia emeryi]|uniref:classical arabinogalactan protein 10-like n=1 Tax=Vollenhovia emeryi TaxID=411798 RepID=UPI0005F3CE3D|nr:PREDICTED: classical arabinogalactan protein 10-like [Vollenhovia emeryi]
MGRSRRAGLLVQLRRIARAYATPGVFDPRIFDRPLEPNKPALPFHPPSPEKPPLAPIHPHPPPPYRPPDPCPVRAWAPRPPITPAPRPPTTSLGSAPPAPPADATRRPPQEPQALQPRLPPRQTRPCIVRIEALPQKVRIARRPRTQRRAAKDMLSLGYVPPFSFISSVLSLTLSTLYIAISVEYII